MFRTFIAILLISIVVSNDTFAFKKFSEFIEKFDKHYKSIEEFKHRFNIFKNSLNFLSANGHKTKHGYTKFSDMTVEEFKATLTLKIPKDNKFCLPSKLKFLQDTKIAESLDYRALGKVSPVKDQYTCGSCWAFSTTGFLESQILMKNQEPQTLSEQQLVDCDRKIDQGCNGGLQQYAFNYVEEKGIMPDMYYTYLGIEDECRYNSSYATHKVKNVKCHENATTDEIKQYLNEVGPMAIALDATDMMYYDNSILDCSNGELNHAVLLVGYGTENGKDYWIVKNSWGPKWAEKGYVRINQETGKNCGIGIYVVSAELA